MSTMPFTFSFETAQKILFGSGMAGNIGTEARALGSIALLVCGSQTNRATAILKNAEIAIHPFSIPDEPTLEMVAEGVAVAKQYKCDLVIAVGGGSVIDAGKAISALLTNHGPISNYLEVIGKGHPLQHSPAPFIAVPTTSGTGAEVTRNAVLRSTDKCVKVSMRSASMLPRVAIIDPQLTHSVPPSITASTGLDALTQVIEPFVSTKSNPLTDAICEDGIRRAARSLQAAFDDGNNAAAREDMAIASLFAGLALANSGLGAVHGFAAPMGGMFPIPHGVICGRLLPFVFAANAAALPKNSVAMAKFIHVARLLTDNPNAGIDDGIRWLDALCSHLAVRPFSKYGVTESHINEIVAAAKRASSMKGNPVPLTDAALKNVLRQAL